MSVTGTDWHPSRMPSAMSSAKLAVAELTPITRRMAELTADPGEIDRLLGKGAEKAAAIAEPILARTYEIVGMVNPGSKRARSREDRT